MPYWNGLKRTPVKKKRSKPRPGRLQGADLEKLRLDCWTRDLGICQKCGKKTIRDAPHEHPDSFHMAHLKAKRIGLDTLPNVATWCGECHRRWHNYGPSMTKPCPPKRRYGKSK